MAGLGFDGFSVGFVFLRLWVVILILISGMVKILGRGTLLLYLLIYLLLVLVFICLDFIMFYLTFEAVLVPTFVLILGWGYQPERLGAGMYLLFYTVFCSLPLLVLIIQVGLMRGVL